MKIFLKTEEIARADVGTNLSYLLSLRLCADCRSDLDAEQAASEDPGVFMARLSFCCAERAGYLEPETPLVELVFRVLAAQGGVPMSSRDVVAAIHLARAVGERQVNQSIVEALVSADEYYGLGLASEEERDEKPVEIRSEC